MTQWRRQQMGLLRFKIAALFVGCLLTASGCVRFEHPLSEIGKVVTDEGMIGTWKEVDPIFGERSRESLEITVGNDGEYHFAFASDGGDGYSGKLIEAAGGTFLEVATACLDGEILDVALQPPPGFIPTVLRVQRKGDWIAIDSASSKVFDKFIQERRELTGKPAKAIGGETIVTSSAEELAAFLSRHADEAFPFRHVFRRVSQ